MRHDMRVGVALFAAALFAVPMAASATDKTADKPETKMEKVEGKVKDTAQSVKGTASDSWLTSKAKIALFADERVKGTQVHVETMKGVVHLRGKVDTEDAKKAAGDVAGRLEGVKSVKNDLQVVAPASRKTVDANDEQIAKSVESRFAKDATLKKIDVRSDAGVVILTGKVPTIMASAKASEMARAVPGVKWVRNELTYTN
jgi:hyperosmotically inducible protein